MISGWKRACDDNGGRKRRAAERGAQGVFKRGFRFF
jgi:hypothetical protein